MLAWGEIRGCRCLGIRELSGHRSYHGAAMASSDGRNSAEAPLAPEILSCNGFEEVSYILTIYGRFALPSRPRQERRLLIATSTYM